MRRISRSFHHAVRRRGSWSRPVHNKSLVCGLSPCIYLGAIRAGLFCLPINLNQLSSYLGLRIPFQVFQIWPLGYWLTRHRPSLSCCGEAEVTCLGNIIFIQVGIRCLRHLKYLVHFKGLLLQGESLKWQVWGLTCNIEKSNIYSTFTVKNE